MAVLYEACLCHRAIMSVDNFLTYIGVTMDPNDEEAMKTAGKRRSVVLT